MKAHYLQHVPFEGLGSIEPWLMEEGYEISNTRLFESTHFPNLKDVDFLFVMGGPMSINDEDEFPWLVQEKQFIQRAVKAGKPILGVCLGAQLIASAMGARVYPNHLKEIGWYPVNTVHSNDSMTIQLPETIDVFHWHGETFELPAGAVHLAESDGCDNQAFQLGRSVIGLQFHLETTPETARDLVANCRAELSKSKYVQSESELIEAEIAKYRAINELMVEVLSYLQDK